MRNRIARTDFCNDTRRVNPCIIDLATLGASMIVSVRGIDTMSFQIEQLDAGTTWPSGAVLTVEYSNDGQTFSAVPAGAVTYNTAKVQAALTVQAVEFVRISVTTAAGSSARVRITAAGEGSGA